MNSFSLRPFISGLECVLALTVLVVGLTGCQSKQDAAIEHAKQQAASTGQPQTVTSTDKNGSTVTTVVQPPAAGQKQGVVTTTVTPKPAAATTTDAANGAAAQAGSQPGAGQQTAPATPPPPPVNVPAGTELEIRIDQRISAKHSVPGEKFTGEIVDPVRDSTNNEII